MGRLLTEAELGAHSNDVRCMALSAAPPPEGPRPWVTLAAMGSLLLWTLLGLAQAGKAHDYDCCSSAPVDAVVSAWLDVHEALAKPTPSDASVRKALSGLAQAADTKLPSAEQPVVDRIEELAKRSSGRSAAELRASDDLGILAGQVVWLSLRYEGGSGSVVQARCAGLGTWLQRDAKTVQNPWGRRCGHFL